MNLLKLILEHPYILAYVASAAINTALRFKSAEEWVKFGNRWPAVAAVIRVSRALGVDPVKAINAVRSLLQERAKEPVCGDADAKCKKSSKRLTDDVAGPAKYKNPREE